MQFDHLHEILSLVLVLYDFLVERGSYRGVVSYSVVGGSSQKRPKFLNFSVKLCKIRGEI